LLERWAKEDARKDLTITYIETGAKLAKLYAPAVAVGVLSIGGILASNNILRQRNVALAAAYATVDKCFKEYRKRVSERFGEDFDRELRYGIKAKRIEKTFVDENGEEKKVEETVSVAEELSGYSDYARFFDEASPYWDAQPEMNLMFLRQMQNYANDLLKRNKHLFLNEVYDMLGLQKSKAGQVVGWVYDSKHPIGDNCVDFGMYDIHRPAVRNFVNGYEPSILLDFNVDGNIWDLM
jgi:hypothetical protein